MYLPHYRSSLVDLPPVGQDRGLPQPEHPHQHVVVVDQRQEDLLATAGLVIDALQPDRIVVRLDPPRCSVAHLPVPDLVYPLPPLLEVALDHLPQVPPPGSGGYVLLRNVPLDVLDPHPPGEESVDPDQVLEGLLLGQSPVLPPPPHLVERGPGEDERRIDLQHVGPERWILEDEPEGLHIPVEVASGQPGHEVVAHLVAGVLEDAGGLDHVLNGVTPPHPLEHVVEGALHPYLHPRRPQVEHPVHVLLLRPVGPRLDGEGHAPRPGRLVHGVGLQQTTGSDLAPGERVEGVEGPPDEPLLVGEGHGREGAAHQDHLHLRGEEARHEVLLEPHPDLLEGIVAYPGGPHDGGAPVHVALGRPPASGAVDAPAVRARVRSGHHRYDGDPRSDPGPPDGPQPQALHGHLRPSPPPPRDSQRTSGI